MTVIAGGRLGGKVLLNGADLLDGPLVFDLTRHQLKYAAQRPAHDFVQGALLKPEAHPAKVTLEPGKIHQTILGFGGSPSIPAYAELSDAGRHEYWQLLKHYNPLLAREYTTGISPRIAQLSLKLFF